MLTYSSLFIVQEPAETYSCGNIASKMQKSICTF